MLSGMKLAMFFLLVFPLVALGDASSFKAQMEEAALRYFIDHAHPATGQVRDKADNFQVTPASNRVASIAATGFGLAVLANAAKRGLVGREVTEQKLVRTLEFARDRIPRHKGWFLHWYDWETGARAWNSEYSPIDTALFIAGALYASQVFPESRLAAITRELYRELDFHHYLTNDGTKPGKKTMALSYSSENGFAPYEWEIYAEQKIMLLLGLGHPTRPLPVDVWTGFKRYASVEAWVTQIMGLEMPLFIHQYSEVFVDFRSLNDGPNYFQNGVRASQVHREMRASARRYKTFAEGFWGVSAGEDPDGYKVYDPIRYQGTVCIGCTVASAMFLPREVLADVEAWYNGPHRAKIWGRYGFTDSINLDRQWFAKNALGITVGPAYMSLANMAPDTSIWQDFMQVPEIKAALKKITNKKLQ